MCSTPKPKRSVKAKIATNSIGVLSSMSNEKRRSFADRANQASDRRIEALQLKRESQRNINNLMTKKSSPKKTKTKANTYQPWFYWLLNAPLGELLRKLVA